MTSNIIIKITNISKVYRKVKISIPALSKINIEIKSGEFVTVVGKSGSGKSTLLNLIGGLDRPSSGNIFIKDRDISLMSRSELANHRKFSVGMIFQSFNLIPSRNAIENISLALAFGGIPRRNRKKKAIELLTKLGLEERIEHNPGELSGGETQRVAIARALANNPEIILADEPTGNLDSQTSEEIIELLQDMNRKNNKTIIMVTHDLEAAKIVSDRIIRLKDGKVIN